MEQKLSWKGEEEFPRNTGQGVALQAKETTCGPEARNDVACLMCSEESGGARAQRERRDNRGASGGQAWPEQAG